MFVCCECCVLSGRGLCDEVITHPEESYRLWCVVVCDLETSIIGAPYIYIYDISSLRVNTEEEGTILYRNNSVHLSLTLCDVPDDVIFKVGFPLLPVMEHVS
jgi:hypothetical protein